MGVGDALLNLTGFRRMDLLRQAEAAECGLACVGMAASYFGYRTDLTTLRREHAISLKGSTLKDVIDIAAQIGLGSRAVRCELEELKDLRAPAILHWDMNHFVVLKSANRKEIILYDPAKGKRTLKLEDANEHFTGVALELAPTPKFQRGKVRKPVKLTSLVKLDSATWKALGQGLVLSLILQVFVLLSPYYMQIVIDEAVMKGDLSLLGAVAVGFTLLKLFEVATTILRGLVFQFLSNVISFDMRASLFHHMMRLPLTYFHKRHVGDIQQRFQSLQPIKDLVVNGAITAIIDGVLAISIGAILFAYNFQLGLVACAAILLYAVLRFAFLEVSKRLSGDLIVAEAKENTKFLETLRAMQTVKVAGAENTRGSLWRNLAADTINASIRIGNVNIGYDAISQAILGMSTVIIVYLAAQSVIAGAMTVGMITAFLAYKGQLEQRLMTLLEQWIAFKLLDVHLERVADIALHDREKGIDTPALEKEVKGAVSIQNVSFRYAPHEPFILQGANLLIKPGEFVALTGPSGAGKSTLLRLIIGLYSPTAGGVFYDNMPISTWGPATIRSQIGVVMQDDTLLAGTIAENIALFDEKIDMTRVKWAAETACIADDIDMMPMGYRSLVGDMGTTLSGGQQQRVMLARALYRQPKVLVMDEGTAHLDIETEKQINEGLKRLQITRIAAAHRQETINAADRIIHMNNGRVGELKKPEAKKAPVMPLKPDARTSNPALQELLFGSSAMVREGERDK